jgi:hypothetical protein
MDTATYQRYGFGGQTMIEAILLIACISVIVAEIVRRWREAAQRANPRNNRA